MPLSKTQARIQAIQLKTEFENLAAQVRMIDGERVDLDQNSDVVLFERRAAPLPVMDKIERLLQGRTPAPILHSGSAEFSGKEVTSLEVLRTDADYNGNTTTELFSLRTEKKERIFSHYEGKLGPTGSGDLRILTTDEQGNLLSFQSGQRILGVLFPEEPTKL